MAMGWIKALFGRRDRKPLTREQEARLEAEERLDDQRRKVIEDRRAHGRF